MTKFSIAGTIILPEVRYFKGKRQMFHDKITEVCDRDGQRIKCNCSNIDSSGYCAGHRISEKKFIDEYCGGVEPKDYYGG